MPEAMMLPSGEATTSEERYVTAWRAFADRVAELLGGRRVSYDPGLTLRLEDGEAELTQKAAARLHAVALALECAGRLADALRAAADHHDDRCGVLESRGPCDCSRDERRDALAAWDRVRAALGRA